MYTEQLIGGDDGPMVVNEYSSSANVPRDRFPRAAPRNNFPDSGFENSRWGQAAAGEGGLDFGASASEAEI